MSGGDGAELPSVQPTPSYTYTIPTEIDRPDGFYDLVALLLGVLLVWGLALVDVPVLVVGPLVLLAYAVYALSGEPAGDVQFIGWLATKFRHRLGLRRAHEWLFVIGHHARVRWLVDLRRGLARLGVWLRGRAELAAWWLRAACGRVLWGVAWRERS